MMSAVSPIVRGCSKHKGHAKRSSCRACNAAYMRRYLRRKRRERPEWALFERAKERARRRGLPFDLSPRDVLLPSVCPVLGVTLRIGARRSSSSPSLDRIDPRLGYVAGNVRVISDRANKLKGGRQLVDLQALAGRANPTLRREYQMVIEYVRREAILQGVRRRASLPGPRAADWKMVQHYLEHAFSRGVLRRA